MRLYSEQNNPYYYTMDDVNPIEVKRIPSVSVHKYCDKLGIFFAVQKFIDDKRVKINLAELRAIAIDMDNGDKTSELLPLIQKSPIEPSLIVETKNGFHMYFYLTPILITESLKEEWFSKYNELIRKILPNFQVLDDKNKPVLRNNKPIGADPNAKDICRILRVPGFVHRKDPKDPFTIKIYSETEHMYTWDELDQVFAPVQVIESQETVVEEVPNYNVFWDELIQRPIIECLKMLSGTPEVNKEVYSFKDNTNGTIQIWVNGQSTACFIDHYNKIGSSDRGGPTIIQWLKWYGYSYAEIATIAKKILHITASKPTNYKLMLQLVKNKNMVTYQDEVYIYDKKTHVWKIQPSNYIRQIIHKICLDNAIDPNSARVNDIFRLALDHYFELGVAFNNNKSILTFKNLVLDISAPLDIHYLPFSPDYKSTILLPYEYSDTALAIRWEKFIQEVLPDPELRLLVQEMMGYCLTTSVEYHVAFFLDGGGRNGKSTFMEILARMIGVENVSSVSFHNLAGRFGLQDMENKLVNYDPEISSEHVTNTAIFKAIVGGDPVEVERKFKDSYRTKFFCKLIYAANELPTIKDRSLGFFSRMIIIPFEQEFTEERGNIDRHILKKLIPELPGIFNWALIGLQRLTVNKTFTKPKKSIIRLEEYRVENNSLLQFIEERCVKDEQGIISSRRFYIEYTMFCKDSNLKPFAIKKVGMEINKLHRYITRGYHKNTMSYFGISLKTEEF